MKQYCRYCANCFAADDYRCSDHPEGLQPHWTREQINKPNKCPNYVESILGDVDTGKMYHPRKEPVKQVLNGQIRMDI